MNVGLGISSLYSVDGSKKAVDGIGVHTENILSALKNIPNLSTTPVYIRCAKDSFSRCSPKFLACPNVFYAAALPIDCYRRLERYIDVFHATDYRIPKLKNTPVVATLHDAIPLKEPAFSNSRMRLFKNYMMKKHARFADRVITVSHSMVSDIHQYWGVEPQKISVVYNGIDQSWFGKIAPQHTRFVLQDYSINKPFLLMVGTLQPRKNYTRAIDAFLNLPLEIRDGMQLVVVGKEGWSCEQVVARLKKLQQKGQVTWLQYIGRPQLQALYQAATAVMFPSQSEGFGFPIVEGFASGTAVIAGNIDASAEIAAGGAYLVDPKDVDSMSRAIEIVVSDEKVREDLIARGLQRARDFSWESAARQIHEIYQSVI